MSRIPPLLLLLACVACGQSEYVEPPPPEVVVAPPVRRDVTDYIETTGKLVAIDTVEIRARVEGFLQSVEFGEGDVVQKGDLLFVIDPSEFEARVQQADASLDTALAALSLAEATLQRHLEARKSRAVSEIDVLERQAERDVAKARLQAAEATLDRAKLDLGYTRILAPISGRIGRSLVDPGNLVGSGEKTLLTTIVRYDPIYAYFNISERALLEILDATQGISDEEARRRAIREIPVELGRSNDEGYPFLGHLDFTEPELDRETGTLQIRAVFPNPQPIRLIPGSFARGRLPIGKLEGALLVTERALGSDQSGNYVLVVDDENVVEYRSVELGPLVDDLRVIREGLQPDDRVITEGVLRARPGAKVTPLAAAG